MPKAVQDLEARRHRGAPRLQGGADAELSRGRTPVPPRHGDLLHRPPGPADALEPQPLAVVGLGEIDPFAGRAPRRGQGQPRREQDGGARVGHIHETEFPTLLRRPVHRHRRPVRAQRGTRHGCDAPLDQRSRAGGVTFANDDAVAPSSLPQVDEGPLPRLRLEFDPGRVRHRTPHAGRDIDGPQIERAALGLGGRVEHLRPVGGEGGIEVDPRRVHPAEFRTRARRDPHDLGVVRVVAHEGDHRAVRRPRRARVDVAAAGQTAGDARRQLHDPDPAARGERHAPPVGGGRGVDRPVRERG